MMLQINTLELKVIHLSSKITYACPVDVTGHTFIYRRIILANRTWITLSDGHKKDIELIETFTKQNPHFIGIKTREEIIESGITASIAMIKEKIGHEFYRYKVNASENKPKRTTRGMIDFVRNDIEEQEPEYDEEQEPEYDDEGNPIF